MTGLRASSLGGPFGTPNRIHVLSFVILVAFLLVALPSEAIRASAAALDSADFCASARNKTGAVVISEGHEQYNVTWDALLRVCENLTVRFFVLFPMSEQHFYVQFCYQRWSSDSTTVYHWGPIELCFPPALLGYFPKELMDMLVDSGSGHKAGGGLYISDLTNDTKGWGSCRMDVRLLPGTPYVTRQDGEWIGNIIGIKKYTYVFYGSLGSYIPFLNYNYSQGWGVFYDSILTTQARGGMDWGFHRDIYHSLYVHSYPVYSGPFNDTGDPKLEATNNLLRNFRKIVASFVASGNPLRWLAAALSSPSDIVVALEPNSTASDRDLFEGRLRDVYYAFRNSRFPVRNPDVKDPRYLEQYIPALTGAPFPLQPNEFPQVLRDYPYADEVWATRPYLRQLEKNPFVNVVGIKEAMNVTTSAGETFSIFKVSVRGISAYQNDWKKLFQTGTLPTDHPLLKLLQDETICCAANKTQLLIAAAIDVVELAKVLPSAEARQMSVVSTVANVSWILPFKESVIPRWASHGLTRFSINRLGWRWTPFAETASSVGISEAVQYVRLLPLPVYPRCPRSSIRESNLMPTSSSMQLFESPSYQESWQEGAGYAMEAILDSALKLAGAAALRDGVSVSIPKILANLNPRTIVEAYIGTPLAPDVNMKALLDAAAAKNWPLAYSILHPTLNPERVAGKAL